VYASTHPGYARAAERFRSVAAQENIMTLCPVAIAVGCKKCPVFAVCPLKTVIGDYRPEHEPKAKASTAASKKKRAAPPK